MRRLILLLVLFGCATAADTFVDLASVATSSRLDDGIADNGAGGWTDEGINDMFLFPAIPVGTLVRNGYPFTLIDAAANGGKDVVVLRGAKRAQSMPLAVEVAVPKVAGHFVYFLHHTTASVAKQDPGYVVATYTIHYSDGSSVEAAMHDGIEMQPWWCNQWYDNHGAEAWPIVMGVNPYSIKWKKHIGVWATCWENPHPTKLISSITLASHGQAAPVIWAITISDKDYYRDNPDLKKNYVRVDAPPSGYFAERMRIERDALYQAAIAEGVLKGLVRVEAIRANLLAITVDSAFGRIGAGDGADVLPELQKEASFHITAVDGKAMSVSAIGRQTVEAWHGDVSSFPANVFTHHTFYLRLPDKGLEAGRAYRIAIDHIDSPLTSKTTFTWDPRRSASPAIKVNQVGYAAAAKTRCAYLGWWAGDLGTILFDDCGTYQVVSTTDDHVVYEGSIAFSDSDELSGERPGRLDLAQVGPGSYRIVVPGVGASFPFRIGSGSERELAYHTQRAFFHQRAGCELTKEFTDFPRPASHLDVYESGYLVGNSSYQPRPGEAVRRFRGGYHDAGDDDVFTYHLRATAQMLHVYALHPKAFADGDLHLPESGNGIPDLLDEAAWALGFFLENQQPDGAIPLGRGNDADWIRDYERSHGERPPFGILPERNTSATEFAATAALYARLIRPFDGSAADRYLAASERAFAWVMARPIADDQGDRGDALFRLWAAAELLAATGSDVHAKTFAGLYADGYLTKAHWKMADMLGLVEWAYLQVDPTHSDATIRGEVQDRFLKRANGLVTALNSHPYAMSWTGKGSIGWGTGNGGGYYGFYLVLAHALSNEQRYLDAASQNADFQLGVNPISRCFITGLGSRPPLNPQLNPLLYSGPKKTGTTVPGISIYGLAGKSPQTDIARWYPHSVPVLRGYRDLGAGVEICSEFTITETIGVAAALYGYLDAVARNP